MATIAHRGTSEPGQYNVIGTSPIGQDGIDKVTGVARYGADINLPGMLHGKILGSPHAHARIRSIDLSKAEAVPGVKAVATSKDFPIIERHNSGPVAGGAIRVLAENNLADKKVLYKGHPVVAIAATSPHIAEEALSLITVDYEVLPTVLGWREAMKRGAILLHEDLTEKFSASRAGAPEDTGNKSNVASHLQLKTGDVEKGFKEADTILEREYDTQTIHQGYIEPFAFTAYWAPNGRLTIWTSTQGIFDVRTAVAEILEIPESTIKVVPMEVGGAFGGKGPAGEPVAAVLSKKSGRSVRMIMSRQEVFEATGPSSGTFITVKIGAKKDGTITAAQSSMIYEAGAYPGSPMVAGVTSGLSAYKIDNLMLDGYDVVCNKPKAAAYRAPGHPQAAFAVESALDELAQNLGMDPMDLRLKNVAVEGDRPITGVPHAHVGLREVMEAIKAHSHYTAPLGGPNRARGVATGYRLNVGGRGSSATINVTPDGSVTLSTGSMDLSGTRVSLAMQVAEVLGISAEDVNSQVGDTDSVGWTGRSGGSRTTFDTGRAAIAATRQVIEQMSARAALLWETESEDVEFADGTFICTKNTNDKLGFKELAGRLMATGGPVTCSAMDSQAGVGGALAGNIFDVEVDPETGKVEILRSTAFMDVGQAAHVASVEGQMQGGTLQGVGWALSEEYFFTPEGAMTNTSFLDYR
ncbi:MAG: xanthine dehydrogenase family protein molybdopterin-binding subunit, partial [Dehalococcoidia bacterium]|nr:xanthine dehydrogenase family protein molybdopterin-binding subunit [Dehalococcoidia bacterium]